MNPAAEIGGAVLVAVVALIVLFYLWVYLRNRAYGRPGLLARSRLTCPKCGTSFDYDFVPGVSLTAVRLGTARYMSCPYCHRWSVFDMTVPSPATHPPTRQ